MERWAYLKLKLARGPGPRAALIAALTTHGLTGGRAVGLFTPQLGWEASEAAMLARQSAEGGASLPDPSLAETLQAWTMSPTARPRGDAPPRPGGIWVHRTFVVKASDVDAFVGLSAEAWPDFESRFDATIFGLFLVDAAADAAERTLLLITRYADHGVWETSRDPTTDAMQTFMKRAALTLRTQAASTLLAAAP